MSTPRGRLHLGMPPVVFIIVVATTTSVALYFFAGGKQVARQLLARLHVEGNRTSSTNWHSPSRHADQGDSGVKGLGASHSGPTDRHLTFQPQGEPWKPDDSRSGHKASVVPDPHALSRPVTPDINAQDTSNGDAPEADAARPADATPDIVLVGVFVGRQETVALLRVRGKMRSVRCGDSVGTWKVARISTGDGASAIILQDRNMHHREIRIARDDSSASRPEERTDAAPRPLPPPSPSSAVPPPPPAGAPAPHEERGQPPVPETGTSPAGAPDGPPQGSPAPSDVPPSP